MLIKIAICLIISIWSTTALPAVKVPKYLAIYYGWPSYVQGSNGNVTAATNWFKQFDLIVLGDGIWKTTHGDNANTKIIIKNLRALSKKVLGYVDLGVSTQNLTYTQMQQAVDGWYAMNATGIFWDDAGYDYYVTRKRQVDMIQYSHSKGMNVIMNAWNPDDVLGGANMTLTSNDIYLLESYLIDNGHYTSLTDWDTKAKKCANYQNTTGVQMACVATPNTPNITDQFYQAWFGTAMYNFDYFQATDNSYSSNNNILTFRANPSSSYGTTWQSTTVASNATKTYFARSTESWKLIVTGDGATWGYGSFLPVATG